MATSKKQTMASMSRAASCATIEHMPDDAFYVTLSQLDCASLCALDATCRTFLSLNRALGLWRLLGTNQFAGLEIEERGMFASATVPATGDPVPRQSSAQSTTSTITTKPTPCGHRRQTKDGQRAPVLALGHMRERHVLWKLRFAQFAKEVKEFRSPFDSDDISLVASPDEVAYTKVRFRADILKAHPEIKIYMEVDVAANADNLSLAIVDFDEGGKSSVTFSPDTGAVIKETKVQETPRKVKGAYIQPVKPNFTKFEGKIGIYISNGLIAFFRQYARHQWESTGFVVDFSWARGQRLTPCLAFRDEGRYQTKISKISSVPPFEPPAHNEEAFVPARWKELNWEGGANV